MLSRLFLSAAASLLQLHREVTTALSNVLLCKRDAVLDLLPSQTPAGDLQALRCSSLSSAMLFDPAVVDSTLGHIDLSIQRAANLRMSDRDLPDRLPIRANAVARSARRKGEGR